MSRAIAAVHPVPLDKNVDAAKCLECHEDKTKGKAVHSAIAMGCLTCHEVRVNKDITRIKLITSTPQSLCITCHADKDAATLKGTVHPPAVRDCLKCHDPHTSDNKFQLLKATSGEKGKNLCLDCHTQGLNVPEKGSRHAALDMGCDTCHTTHKVGERGKQEFDNHLTPRRQRRGANQDAPGAALWHGYLYPVPRSPSIGAAEVDAEVHASSLRRQDLRDLPLSGERWQSGFDECRFASTLRDLS
jgi:predicted CXXCH cytochrome family protein